MRWSNEIAGSLGDLATFLPLAIGLITVNGLNATALFLSAGMLYIGSGLYYGLPIPVQPLKATSAIAITLAVRPEEVSATAFCMGVLFIFVSLFDVGGFLGKVFTRPIVRGIQHARLVRDVLDSVRESVIVAGIGLATLATGNLAVAFGGGILLNAIIARAVRKGSSRKTVEEIPA